MIHKELLTQLNQKMDISVDRIFNKYGSNLTKETFNKVVVAMYIAGATDILEILNNEK